MATTRKDRIGRVRARLAPMLESALSAEFGRPVVVDPADIESQIPYYARPEADCCSWFGKATTADDESKAVTLSLCSWTRMSDVIRSPIGIVRNAYRDPYSVEIV